MSFVSCQLNPYGRIDDGEIRAIIVALGYDWEQAYINLFSHGLDKKISIHSAMEFLLQENGFRKAVLSSDKRPGYTIEEFCQDNPSGLYIIVTHNRVVPVLNGNHYDAIDSKREIVSYYYLKKEE